MFIRTRYKLSYDGQNLRVIELLSGDEREACEEDPSSTTETNPTWHEKESSMLEVNKHPDANVLVKR